MGPNENTQISVALAIDQVKDATERVHKLNMELKFARSERDRYIKEASSFMPISQIMKVTGLSRDTIHRIKNSPDH